MLYNRTVYKLIPCLGQLNYFAIANFQQFHVNHHTFLYNKKGNPRNERQQILKISVWLLQKELEISIAGKTIRLWTLLKMGNQ